MDTIATTSRDNTVRLHRVVRAPADLVYRAFLEPKAMCKWFPPHGFVGNVHHSDVRVGGGYRMSFTNFRTGQSHSFSGRYDELVPGQRIRYSNRFEDPNMPEEMRVTVTLKAVSCCTALEIVQENLPAQIPIELCYLGWQESLSLLAMLVEAEVP